MLPLLQSVRSLFRRCLAPAMLAAVLPLAAHPVAAQDHAHPAGDPAALGTVEFPVSCDAAVQPDFERAVAMLHSFWFDAAGAAFEDIARRDPACALAHWGLAVAMMGNPMTRAAPGAEPLAAGAAAARRAGELVQKASHREQMYVDAALAYYADYETRPHAERMQAMEAAFDALRGAHADDMEATVFYARTAIANAPPTDLTFARQIHAAELLQPLFDAHPDHPGLAHYLIHAYDAPALAARATDAAFAYADIAPAAPHALHMPSHIFTRLGYWDESIETNARSARAEPDSNAAVHPMDYLVYAYLQQGRDAEASAVVARAVQNPDRFYGGLLGYNFAAMPARYALERDAWAEAAALRVPVGATPFVEAVTRFARAIGAAREGNAEHARTETAALAELQGKLVEQGDTYWATIVEAQRLAAEAWIALASDDADTALRVAREAADLEETVEKHPVTPGPILPARELLGDMLMALDRPADALIEYQATLTREPRRARTLAGAARAARLAGNGAAATALYTELVDVMSSATAQRPELLEASAHLRTAGASRR